MSINYHDLSETDNLKHMILAILGILDLRSKGQWDEWSEASKGFTEIDLKISVNGFEVDGEAFVNRFAEEFDTAVEYEARRMLELSSPLQEFREKTDELQEIITDVTGILKDQIRKAGFDPHEW